MLSMLSRIHDPFYETETGLGTGQTRSVLINAAASWNPLMDTGGILRNAGACLGVPCSTWAMDLTLANVLKESSDCAGHADKRL